jgi:type II secretory pathway pseudopilin PulG
MQDNNPKTNQKKSPFERSVELILSIIIILLILGAFVFPPIHRDARRARVAKTKVEMNSILSAITAYQSTYGRFPVPPNLATNNSSDFAFGTFNTSAASIGITNASGYQANNSDVMAILMDLTKFPNGKNTVNADHHLNPQQTPFLNMMISSDTKSPGVGLDGVYRDPWGNPYIITLDLNHDRRCRDAFYRLASVSEIDSSSTNGLNRLIRPAPPPYNSPETRDAFEAQTPIMVWSLGPDGKADAAQKADAGVNKDNVLSW